MTRTGLLLAGLACTAAAPLPASPRPVTIVAHRGLTEDAPENTLAAIRQSIGRGVTVMEVDVRPTRDGQLVLLHDASLGRTTNCHGALAGFTLASLKSCDAGGPAHQGERIPTLREALALVDGSSTRLLLDIKPGTSLDAVIAEVRASNAASKIIFGLRRTDQVVDAKAAMPDAMILAFMPRMSDAPAFTAAGAKIIRLWSDWVETDSALIPRVRALGPQVWVLVGRRLPHDESEWRALHGRMMRLNVDGLITNRPELVTIP